MSGLQCHKRLWNEDKHPNRAADISRSQQRRFDQSKEVGILARDYFPEGVLVDAIAPLVSVKQTEEFIKRGDACIFEASFIFNDVWLNATSFRKTQTHGNSLK